MSAALQIAYAPFDEDFFKLPNDVQERIQEKIDDLGRRLASYPHQRLVGSNRYRLRVGNYRIIYTFDLERRIIHSLAVGHRREIYR